MAAVNKFFLLLFLCSVCMTMLHAQGDDCFVLVKDGRYSVGKKGHMLNPARQVTLQHFFIGCTEITNRQFERFVLSAGYITDAEKKRNALVFAPGLKEFDWMDDSTAYWR